MKQKSDSIKAETNSELAINAKAYADGKKSYQQFIDDKGKIQVQGFAKLKSLYGEDSNEYKQLLDNQLNAVQQHDEAIIKIERKDIEREKLLNEANIKAQYYDKNSAIYQNDIALTRHCIKTRSVLWQTSQTLQRG